MRKTRFTLLLAALGFATSLSATELQRAIDSDYPYLEGLFKHLHANPELSMQEFETSDRLAAELSGLGYVVTRGINKTGLEYASAARQVNLESIEMPVMHACGHDMHVTSLVGVARRMVELKDQWSGTLMLLGQPAEEALGGAKGMVADGLYERMGRPDYALALHVIAKYPAGKIAFNDGLMYSSADTVRP